MLPLAYASAAFSALVEAEDVTPYEFFNSSILDYAKYFLQNPDGGKTRDLEYSQAKMYTLGSYDLTKADIDKQEEKDATGLLAVPSPKYNNSKDIAPAISHSEKFPDFYYVTYRVLPMTTYDKIIKEKLKGNELDTRLVEESVFNIRLAIPTESETFKKIERDAIKTASKRILLENKGWNKGDN